jgi:hypothetical protein
MDSPLTIKLKSSANTILRYIEKLNKYFTISTYHIITYSVILNAFAVLTLLNNEFTLFVLLFSTSFYIQIVAKVNKRKKNDLTRLTKIYGRTSIWIMLITVFYAVVFCYKEQITMPVVALFIFLLIMCNINYSLKILNKIENNEFDDNGDLNTYFIDKWSKMFSLIKIEKREHIANVTKWFDEPSIIVIFIFIIIYINYIKQSNFKVI